MPIAGALVIPRSKDVETVLTARLASVSGVSVEESGPKGIAIVMEAADSGELKRISRTIELWEEVLEFELAYFNWEDETD